MPEEDEELNDFAGYVLNAVGILRWALRGERWALDVAEQNLTGMEEYAREFLDDDGDEDEDEDDDDDEES